MNRKALGFALVSCLGIGTAVLAVALRLPTAPAAAGGDVQHAVLTTDAGTVLPAAGSCPYLARRAAATACPSPARRSVVGSCPSLAGGAGGDCPAWGGGGGSACPRAGRTSATPRAERTDRGVLLASMEPGTAPTVPADPA